jgi:DNA-binding response OmpR family regulator
MKLRVVAVDSDLDVLRLIEIKLRRAGFQVLKASDGDQGLAMVLAHRPDVLVTEVMLPGRDGMSLVTEVRRQLGAQAPIAILLSSSGKEADIVEGLSRGADDYIIKPFSPRELIARVMVAAVKAGLHADPKAPAPATPEAST